MIHVGHIIFTPRKTSFQLWELCTYRLSYFRVGREWKKIYPKITFRRNSPHTFSQNMLRALMSTHKVSCVVDSQKYFDYQRRLSRSHLGPEHLSYHHKKSLFSLGLHSLPHVFLFEFLMHGKSPFGEFPGWNLFSLKPFHMNLLEVGRHFRCGFGKK